MGKPVSKDLFYKDEKLVGEYGSYDNYVNSFNTNTTKPKSAYDTYIEEARNIYNQSVEENKQNAQNQIALAGAEYREVNRNLNEINKANNTANTGYEGDTSIDAYNAYRNSVNSINKTTEKTNNDLYSYYLNEVSRLEQAKQDETYYNDNKIANVENKIENLKGEDAYDSAGYITDETAGRIWEYVTGIYGEDVPDEIMANLNSEKGFSEWLEAYNDTTKTYERGDTFNSIDSYLTGNSDYKNVSDEEYDDFMINYNGTTYKLEGKIPNLSATEMYLIDSKLGTKEGSILYFNGKLYVRTTSGDIREAIGTEKDKGNGGRDLINAIKESNK